MNRFKATASLVLGGLLLIVADAALAATVTCESRNNSRQTCSADTSGGARVSQQLSSQGCWQGDTWGYDRNRIWVDRGCRAVFQVGAQRSSSSSNSDAIAAAAVVGIAAAALIASNKNNHNEKHDNSYYDNRYRDYDRPEVYDNSRYGYNGYGGDPRRTFSCESKDNRTSYCEIPVRGHVEVFRQRSSRPCIHGQSWGVRGNQVWVEQGCRAEFAVF
jgi:Protein of unknown function (DUF3011)